MNIDIQKYIAKCIVLLEFFVNIKLSVAREDHILCVKWLLTEGFINLVNFKSFRKIDEVLVYHWT